MAKQVWEVNIPREGYSSRKHVVELDHSFWTNRRTILVDGRRLGKEEIRRSGLYEFGSDDRFQINGQECVIQTVAGRKGYNFDLFVDGVSVANGAPLVPSQWKQRLLGTIAGVGLVFSGYGGVALSVLAADIRLPEDDAREGMFVFVIPLGSLFVSSILARTKPWKWLVPRSWTVAGLLILNLIVSFSSATLLAYFTKPWVR